MTGQETARVISALEREYPSRRNDELSEQDRSERLVIWAAALKDVSYGDMVSALPQVFTDCKFFPKLPELISVIKNNKPDPMDIGAAEDGEYRKMFPDWMKHGLNRTQRMERMQKAKLENKPNLRIAE